MTTLAARNAAREAERVLSTVWREGYPVDPVLIAHRLGVDVREAVLSANISGALIKHLGEDPTIILNASDHSNRQRFTCAHELGHFVAHEDDPDEYEYVDLRDTIWSAAGTQPEEIWANTFAANLLMPEQEVRRLKSEGYTPTQMAVRFGVSQDAMHFRLKNLKLDD